jgi:hypothetical protein
MGLTETAFAWEDQEAVEAARDGLRRSLRYPWYDVDSDTLRRLDAVPRTPPPEARDWQWNPTPIWQNRWSWSIAGFWDFVQVLVWIVLGAFLLGMVFVLVRAFLRNETTGSTDSQGARGRTEGIDDAQQLDNLPFAVRRGRIDLLAQARLHYERGEYSDAVIFLFSYQLVQLDKHHLIRLAKGKTNRQYLRELRPRRELFQLVNQTTISFEQAFFGKHVLSRGQFERCWHELDQFHQFTSGMPQAD